MQDEKTKKIIRVILTVGVILTGAYYIQRSTSVTEILSEDIVNDAQADVPCSKC